jgi:hypothetical protein
MKTLCLFFLLTGTLLSGKLSDLDEYAGVYKLAPNGVIETFTVTVESGNLMGQANGFDKTQLIPQKEEHTFKTGYGSTVVFLQDAQTKKFSKIKLVVQDNEVSGVKQ